MSEVEIHFNNSYQGILTLVLCANRANKTNEIEKKIFEPKSCYHSNYESFFCSILFFFFFLFSCRYFCIGAGFLSFIHFFFRFFFALVIHIIAMCSQWDVTKYLIFQKGTQYKYHHHLSITSQFMQIREMSTKHRKKNPCLDKRRKKKKITKKTSNIVIKDTVRYR